MKKMIIAVAVIAIAAAMCIPACVFADSSDAASKTNGSAGISVELNTTAESEIVKFIPKAVWNDDATSVWNSYVFDGLFSSRGSYNVTEGKINEVKFTRSMGREITDDYVSNVGSDSRVMEYSFKATCQTSDLPFINSSLGQLIKYLEPKNVTHKDATLTIKVTVEETESTVTKQYITKNTDNNFVVTESFGESLEYLKVKAEVKYSYGTDEKEFTYEKTIDAYSKGTAKLDFMGVDPKDAKVTTNVLLSLDIDDLRAIEETVVKCDGKTYTNKTDAGPSIMGTRELSTYGTLSSTYLITEDLSVPTYKFYGDDSYSVFDETMVDDASLKSNDAMKNYVKEKGSVGEDFSAAKSTAESQMPSSGGPNILLFVAIGIGAVVIIAIVAFIFLKKK